MGSSLSPLTIDDLFADTDASTDGRHPGGTSGSPWYHPDEGEADQVHRDRVRAAGLASGRIRGWTALTGRRLWAQWLARFDSDADVARDAALWAAERLVRDKRVMTQERLFAIKRVFLGIPRARSARCAPRATRRGGSVAA